MYKLPCLEELKLACNPLNDTDKPTNIRQLFVAKLKKLKILNRTVIVLNERQGSEYDYLKKYYSEYITIKNEPNGEKAKEFFLAHPSYLELIESKLFFEGKNVIQ